MRSQNRYRSRHLWWHKEVHNLRFSTTSCGGGRFRFREGNMSPFRLILRMVLVEVVSHLAAHFPVAVTAVNLQQHLSLHRTASTSQQKLQKRNIFANEIYDIAQDGCSCGCCIVTEVHRKLTCRRINLTTLDQANNDNEDGEPTGQCQEATCTEVSAGYESAQVPLPLICHATYPIHPLRLGTVSMTSCGSPSSTTLQCKFVMQNRHSC